MSLGHNGYLNNEQQEMEPHFVRYAVGDMVHGAEGYIADFAWWVDESNKVWIDTLAPIFSDDPNELDELMEHSHRVVRCVRLHRKDKSGKYFDGWVIDSSYYSFIDDQVSTQIRKDQTQDDAEDIDESDDLSNLVIERRVNFRHTDTLSHAELQYRRPVIGVIANETSLESITKTLVRQFDIKLGWCGIKAYYEDEIIEVSEDLDDDADDPE